MPTLTKLYTMEEASQHNTKDDCWVVINGKVYEVTRYLDDHPGGDDVLLAATGKDATEEFEDAGHSGSARELMEDFCIGEIEPSSPAIPELEIFAKKQPKVLGQKLMDSTTQYWFLSVGIVGISLAASAYLCMRKK